MCLLAMYIYISQIFLDEQIIALASIDQRCKLIATYISENR